MTKYMPMLCETAPRPSDYYINHDDWRAEQKLDGHHVLMSVYNGEPTPYNRYGEVFRQSMPRTVLDDFRNPVFGGEWIFDGELLNGRYNVFDIRIADNLGAPLDLTTTPYDTRRMFLEGIFSRKWVPFHTDLVASVSTTHGKQDLFDKIEAAGGEGVIFKHREGIYYPGRRSHHALKFKFVDTADVIVSSVWREGKRSVGIEAYENGEIVDLGACTMTERNLGRVKVGDVIEVKYLYRGAGGRLFQPRFLRVRDDKNATDCTTDTIKNVNKEIIT